MRDAQSKLDQVIAFTGSSIGADDVSTVLGLVGRDLVLDTAQAVADEDASAAFVIAGRAVELGYDLRLVCRELSRVVRDLLVLTVDPARIQDPEIAGEGERDRLMGLAGRFSREDLLRAFDLLTRAEADIRGAAQPRYHLEMALLRWIYLRKLTPIEDLIAGVGRAEQGVASGSSPIAPKPPPPPSGPDVGSGFSRTAAPQPAPPQPAPRKPAPPQPAPPQAGADVASGFSRTGAPPAGNFKDALLAEIRRSKTVFYNTVVAQAQRIDVAGDRVTFTFSAAQRAIRDMFEQNRAWLESVSQKLAGRRVIVESGPAGAAAPAAPAAAEPPAEAAAKSDRKSALKEQALADAGVQALLEVFPAEIRDVEEM
jgi:DNA polymerase-3 subunit gamma/tau